MGTSTTYVFGGPLNGSVASIINYDVEESVLSGEHRLYFGYQVQANGDITGGTPFSWGTTGATWKPVQFGAFFKGVWSSSVTYVANDVVSSDTTSTSMYTSIADGNLNNIVTNPTKWAAASFNVNPATSIPILAYQVGETYYVGQYICWNGLIVTPNGTVPAGTTFALGTAGATFKISPIPNAWAGYGVEYPSPVQYPGRPPVYRVDFNSSSLPAFLTSGNYVSKVVDYMITFSVGGNRYITRGYTANSPASVIITLSGASGKGNLSMTASSWTIVDGWVDYTK